MNPNLDTVIEILKKEGVKDEAIVEFIKNLTSYLAQQLYLLLVEQLSEEDMQRLQGITNEEEKKKAMQDVFKQKTGQELKALSDQFVKTFTNEFLEGHKLASVQ